MLLWPCALLVHPVGTTCQVDFGFRSATDYRSCHGTIRQESSVHFHPHIRRKTIQLRSEMSLRTRQYTFLDGAAVSAIALGYFLPRTGSFCLLTKLSK